MLFLGEIMKIKKLLYLLIFCQLSVLAGCCCDESQYTPPISFDPTVLVSEMRLALIDNSGENIKYLSQNNDLDTVNKNAFGIVLGLYSTTNLQCLKQEKKTFSLFPTATACHCDDAYIMPPSRFCPLYNFNIKTLSNFDSTKQAGAEITEYFRDFRNNRFNELSADSLILGKNNNLLLMEPPSNSGLYQFVVQFEVSDTLTLTDTTEAVYLF